MKAASVVCESTFSSRSPQLGVVSTHLNVANQMENKRNTF